MSNERRPYSTENRGVRPFCSILLQADYDGTGRCVDRKLACNRCVIGRAYMEKNELTKDEVLDVYAKAMKRKMRHKKHRPSSTV